MINGLPAHVLVVHAVVVLVPLAALVTVLAAVWPAARRRLGIVTPLLALVAVAFVPLATQAGEWLEEHVPESPLVEQHARYGDGVLGWALGLLAVACGVWLVGALADRRRASTAARDDAAPSVSAAGPSTPSWVAAPWARALVAVVTVAVAAGATLAVYRAGDSGARAAWQDQVTSTGNGGGDD
ncbi:DUF2231 domain-containing protein [Cellulomonas sp.]|uniref:DUF2231 domain-containing protein n=1 Tax=Cellulomonas sp. TaxID=40001 RepID=UPI001B01A25E|nr:DUF2231 domain-containing protein [Cellulomonas sp.]MBO9555048.1 hypothetical protein [Cellulomonas sp.]